MLEQQAISLYLEGNSLREVAKLLHVNHMRVKRALKKAGVVIRGKDEAEKLLLRNEDKDE